MSEEKKTFRGKILKAGAYRLNEEERANDKYDNTHRYSIQVGENDYISMGKGKMDNFMVKDDDEKWQVLGKGSEVKVVYTEREGKNGKVFKNSGKSKLTVIDLVPGERFERKEGNKGKTGGGSYSKDNVGMQTGHAVNGACALDGYKKVPSVETAVAIHEVTQQLTERYQEAHPELTKGSVGATVGNAVLNACRIIGRTTKMSVDDLNKVASNILAKLSGPLLEELKEAQSTPQDSDDDPSSDDGNEENDSEEGEAPEIDEWEQDIPFN